MANKMVYLRKQQMVDISDGQRVIHDSVYAAYSSREKVIAELKAWAKRNKAVPCDRPNCFRCVDEDMPNYVYYEYLQEVELVD